MTTLAPRRSALVVSAAALLARWGGSQPPIGPPGAMPQTTAIATRADRGKSWMLPEVRSKNLLYVANGDDSGGGSVSVYSYPEGDYVGTLQGFNNPDGACVDSVGNVFITTANGRHIFEYAHGGKTPIETLGTGSHQPVGCSVDPLTGNLAAANVDGTVLVYRNAKGKPKRYTFEDSGDAYYCSYDDAGNLFVDGFGYYSHNNHFALGELARGSDRFRILNVNGTIDTPGQIQWFGRYLAVGDNEQSVIDHVRIEGSTASISGTTSVEHTSLYAFWIQNHKLINPGVNALQIFKYPGGGASIKSITQDVGNADAVVVSTLPAR